MGNLAPKAETCYIMEISRGVAAIKVLENKISQVYAANWASGYQVNGLFYICRYLNGFDEIASCSIGDNTDH